MNSKIENTRTPLRLLLAGLISWFVLLAIGTAVYCINQDYRKPVVVLLVCATFVLVWTIANHQRQKNSSAGIETSSKD